MTFSNDVAVTIPIIKKFGPEFYVDLDLNQCHDIFLTELKY